MEIFERLYIKNFINIKEFDWRIKEFNVLTGSMGAGKSVCVKLLWFLERILHTLIFTKIYTKDDLSPSILYDKMSKAFETFSFETFNIKGINLRESEINYSYSCNGNKFDLKAIWDKNKKNLKWSSDYLDSHLKQWQGFFGGKSSLDTPDRVTNYIYKSISDEFASTFPVGALFIPASRSIAAIAEINDFSDPFIFNFMKHRDWLNRHIGNVSVEKILHIKNMKHERGKWVIKTLQNGEISLEHLSSGQQELFYLILMINSMESFLDAGYSPFDFSERTSIFIEEPEAHLFPQNQKDIFEHIVETFRFFKDTKNDKTERFFITTHSPYILNIASTMLNRGNLQKKLKELGKNNFNSPYYFNKGEVSAYFIDDKGKALPIVSKDETYMFVDKIQDISQEISDEANAVEEELAIIEG
jgi:predicted ATPase